MKLNYFSRAIITFLILECFCLLPAEASCKDYPCRDNLSPKISFPELKKLFSKNITLQEINDISEASAAGGIGSQPLSQGTLENKYKILLVCNANQERSVLSASLIGMNMPEDLIRYFTTSSSGLRTSVKQDDHLNNYLYRHPALRDHLPKQIDEKQVKEAKIIFVMTESQKNDLIKRYPFAQGKVFLLLGNQDLHTETEDYPERGRTYSVLQEAIKNRLPEIYQILRQLVLSETSPQLAPRSDISTLSYSMLSQAI